MASPFVWRAATGGYFCRVLRHNNLVPDPLDAWLSVFPVALGETAREALAASPDPSSAVAGLGRLVAEAPSESFGSLSPADIARLSVLLGSGPAPVRSLVRAGRDWPELFAYTREKNPGRDGLRKVFALHTAEAGEGLKRDLRRMADRELFRIGARDLYGEATLAETLDAVTALADVAIATAVEVERAALAAGQGGGPVKPDGEPVGFVVMGLGKLGGGELNYSSDVDLVYMYETDHVADGSPTPREFFSKLSGSITAAVGEATADGLVFRVDLRLRPEGLNGPLVNSVENALRYYEGWGDTWERGALMKSRPVGGDTTVGDTFVNGVEPFIYRRHLDFMTVEDLRLMKAKIDAEQEVRAAGKRDVKIGRGGIREIEFVVQALQLIHGGHVPEVRCLGTREGLRRLVERELIAASDAEVLSVAYEFLRNTEHAIQVESRRQTQALPSDFAALRAMARRLGYGRGARGRCATGDAVAAFEADWGRITDSVHSVFLKFMELRPGDVGHEPDREEALAAAILEAIERDDKEAALPALEALGFSDGESAAATLVRIYRGRFRGPASPQRRRAVRSMAPSLLRAVCSSSDPEAALERLVEFLIRTGAHTSYLALLSGSPATMQLLVGLFASSPYLAAKLAGRPELIDSLVRSDAAHPQRSRDELCAALDEQRSGEDEEAVLSALRRFRTAELVRIGMGDLSGTLAPAEVHEQLTLLAEVCLEEAARAARRMVAEKTPEGWDGLELAVVGMGKLGAGEMTYGSDMDLIFVYDTPGRSFDAETHALAARWVQKIIGVLQTRTNDGVAYAVDARLRPSGNSGPLVTFLGRFVEYHQKEADLWERQAQIRSRVVFGPADLKDKIEEIVAASVYAGGLDDAGMREIATMRARVEDELADESAQRVNIKTGRGGIVDVEFMMQALQLRHGNAIPALRTRSTARAIEAAGEAGVFDRDTAERLVGHYTFLRRLEARMRLERDRPVEQMGTDPQALVPLAKRMGFAGEGAGGDLLAHYKSVTEDVRALYEKTFKVG